MKPAFKTILISLLFAFSLTSCDKDEDPIAETQPIDMEDNKTWVDGDIVVDKEVWYRVSCMSTAITATIEWAETSAQGENHTYTGDIMVSAYALDGTTSYFEDKDNGYAEKARSFTLKEGETSFLVKIVLGESNTEGTFGIRATSEAEQSGTVEYTEIAIEDTWTEDEIEEGEVKGYKVKVNESTQLAVVWSEAGAPEDTYTADITGSVYRTDETTVYTYDKDGTTKEFLNKNKSHSDDMKIIVTNPDDKNVKIQIKGISSGTYAIKVIAIN